ncbi:UNVERIFIED_CONTAM: hypothetical protein K2H54_060549 [Gekko kuhli]
MTVIDGSCILSFANPLPLPEEEGREQMMEAEEEEGKQFDDESDRQEAFQRSTCTFPCASAVHDAKDNSAGTDREPPCEAHWAAVKNVVCAGGRENVTVVVTACVILHNVREEKGHMLADADWE